ncbi:TIM barrel protein [Arthrobacter sp. NPDC089319]|uniref:sugar phosphate isomerase/epimerase family protein n=1 Tax=Arthrobacter sp. NPDC089319 TaxID=3155915 RepID=UPI00343CD840
MTAHPRAATNSFDLTASFVSLSGAGFGQPARHSLPDRVKAAAAAGFRGIGLHVEDLPDTEEEWEKSASMIGEAELAVTEFEFLSGWTSGSPATQTAAAVQAARRWGGHHVTAGEFGGAPLDMRAAAEGLAVTAAALEPYGVQVAVEPFAWSSIGTLEAALEIIDASAAPNAGLMIDVWHFFNTGATVDMIQHLPTGAIKAVQLNNGPRVHSDFLANARSKRWLPHEGELDITGLVTAVTAHGYQGPWCVEVNNPSYRELPLQEAASQAFESSRAVLDDALARSDAAYG